MPTQIHAKIEDLEPAAPTRPEMRVHSALRRERNPLASTRALVQRKGGVGRDTDIQVRRQAWAAEAEPPGAARGVLFGMLLSAPIWAALAGFAWLALR